MGGTVSSVEVSNVAQQKQSQSSQVGATTAMKEVSKETRWRAKVAKESIKDMYMSQGFAATAPMVDPLTNQPLPLRERRSRVIIRRGSRSHDDGEIRGEREGLFFFKFLVRDFFIFFFSLPLFEPNRM